MDLQYFIKEGVEGSANLKLLYNFLNNKYFGGSMPKIKVKWSNKLKQATGRATVKYIQPVKKNKLNSFGKYLNEIPVDTNVEIDMKSLEILLSTAVDMNIKDTQAIMLHEMVHILLYTQKKLGGHHGTPEFDGWIKKLKDQSGLEIPFVESNFKASPKLIAKEGYVLLVYQTDGKYGISSYSKNFINNTPLDDLGGMLVRIVKASGRIAKLEMYKVKHHIISSMGAKRSMKGVTWYPIDEEEFNNIKKIGKLFVYADKQKGYMLPKVIGQGKNANTRVEFDSKGRTI